MTLEELKNALQKMNLAQVSRDTGIHHNTLVRIKNNETMKPSYVIVATLIDYIESGFKTRLDP